MIARFHSLGNHLAAALASSPLLAVGMAGALILAGCASWTSPPTAYLLCWLSGIFLSVTLAGFFLRKLHPPAPPFPITPARWHALAFGLAALSGAIIWSAGHSQIGGFDHSVLIDLGWRLVQGQQPYRDFPCTLPVGFVFGAGYALQLFGVSWAAIVGFQAVFSTLTFLWQAFVLRPVAGPGAALGIALACQAAANVVPSYWWYNPATTTAGTLFVFSAFWLWREPVRLAPSLSYTASLALLAAMKPNIGAVLIAGTTLVLLASRRHRWRVLVCSTAATVMFIGWLALHRVTPLEVARSYLSISSRGFSLSQFLQDTDPWEKCGVLLLWAGLMWPWWELIGGARTHEMLRRGETWLAATATLAGTYGFVTNGESKLVDLPLVLVGAWGLNSTRARAGDEFAGRRWLAVCLPMLAVLGITAGVLRHRVKAIGYDAFFEYELSGEELGTPFFRGVRSGNRLVGAEDEVAQLIRSQPGRDIYFGPRMQWAYAAFGISSPRGEPVWWHSGVSFPASDEDHWVERWIAARHDVLVFLRADPRYLPTLLPERFRTSVAQDYQRDTRFRFLIVFVRLHPKGIAPPHDPPR